MAHKRIKRVPEVAAPARADPTPPQAHRSGAVRAVRRPAWWRRYTRRERRPLRLALLVSLLVHALLLSLVFGGDGIGQPGLVFPWQEIGRAHV